MDNRSRILGSALQLFSARGYDAVGVQEVVEAAGITKPTLYHYFGNKIGLVKALIAEYSGRLNDLIREAAAYQGDLPLTLHRVVNAYFLFAASHPGYYRLQLALLFAPPESEVHLVASGRIDEQIGVLEDLFEEAARDHGNMRGRSRAYAATLLGMINTYVGLSLRGQVKLDQELAFKALHQFMHGIYS